MENKVIMGLILKRIEGFDNTYACLGLEEVKLVNDGFLIKDGKYKSITLPVFDNDEELSIFGFNGTAFIDNGICKDYDELKSNFVKQDKCKVLKVKSFDSNSVEFAIMDNVYTDMIDISLDELIDVYNDELIDVYNKDEKIIDIESIDEEVRKSIIGQDSAIKQILSTIYFNQKLYDSDLPDDKARNLKQNILLVGSTGVGKTEIIKQIAKQLDVVCVIEDATRYTIEGYKGSSIEDMIKHLYENADYDIDLAERGILVIDEIDKKSSNDDVSSIASTGVQQALLKLLEGTNYNISGDHDSMLEPFEFNSSYLTVILCGAFSHMDLKKKMEKVVGFTSDKYVSDKKTTKEFKDSGIIPELMGRMSKVIQLNKLTEKEFIKILKDSEISPLRLTKEFYNSLGVEVSYTDSFIEDIARVAKDKDIGARGLKTAFDEAIETLEFDVLSGNVKKIIFNKIDDIKVIKTDEVKKKLVMQK